MKYCCNHCINNRHEELFKFIINNGIFAGHPQNIQLRVEDCSYDSNHNQHTHRWCIEKTKLKDLFQPLIDIYQPNALGERYIWDEIQFHWRIFDRKFSPGNPKALLLDIFPEWKECNSPFLNTRVRRIDSSPERMLEEEWKDFCEDIKERNRFFPKFPEDLKKIIGLCKREIKKGETFYRVRINRKNQKKAYSARQMYKPPHNKIINTVGRGNPPGISYLYLSSDQDLAIHEVRPQIGSFVTVGEFNVIKKLSIIDPSQKYPTPLSPFKFGRELLFILQSNEFLFNLLLTFFDPVEPDKRNIDYLPSQFVCELIKREGFDGIKYFSSLGKSSDFNLMLFETGKVKCVKTHLIKID